MTLIGLVGSIALVASSDQLSKSAKSWIALAGKIAEIVGNTMSSVFGYLTEHKVQLYRSHPGDGISGGGHTAVTDNATDRLASDVPVSGATGVPAGGVAIVMVSGAAAGGATESRRRCCGCAGGPV